MDPCDLMVYQPNVTLVKDWRQEVTQLHDAALRFKALFRPFQSKTLRESFLTSCLRFFFQVSAFLLEFIF